MFKFLFFAFGRYLELTCCFKTGKWKEMKGKWKEKPDIYPDNDIRDSQQIIEDMFLSMEILQLKNTEKTIEKYHFSNS